MNRTKRYYGIIKEGKRWFWCLASDWSLWDSPDDTLIATGKEKSEEEALAKIMEIAGECELRHDRYLHSQAKQHLRAAKIRENGNDGSTQSHKLEFVYDVWGSRYRIVKKTEKQVVIEQDPWGRNRERRGNWYDFHVYTYTLPRIQFERDRKFTHRRLGDIFLSTEEVQEELDKRRRSSTPSHLSALGLTSDATSDEIQKAWRKLAKIHHPDRGGDPEEFKRLRDAYERALEVAS